MALVVAIVATQRDAIAQAVANPGPNAVMTVEPTNAAPPQPVERRIAADAGVPSPPAASAGGTESRPLGAPSARKTGQPAAPGAGPSSSGGVMDHWIVRTAIALAFVLILIFAFRSVAQRLAGRVGGLAMQMGAGGRAPSGVLEVLGRYPVARGQTLVLLRVDRRVLLLGQTSSGFSTLAEFADAEEVASLLIKTRDEDGDSLAERFHGLLRTMERDPSIMGESATVEVRPGFAGGRDDSEARRGAPVTVRERLASLRGGRA